MLTLYTRSLLAAAASLLLFACSDEDKPAGPNAQLFEYKFFAKLDGHLTPNTFSSDGRAIYFTLATTKYKESYVYSTKYHDGELSEPVLAGFSTGKYNSGASISDDGQTVLFTSMRPKGFDSGDDKWNLWTSVRENGVWAPATRLPAPIDSPKPECCATYVSDSVFFFSSKRLGNWDVYRAVLDEDGAYSVERLPDAVNSEYNDWVSSFDPESGLLLFTSARPDGFGHDDVYVSKLVDGDWQTARVLPEPINTASYDDTAILSPNGEWLYFSSNRPVIKDTIHYSVFRIKASILEQLQPSE